MSETRDRPETATATVAGSTRSVSPPCVGASIVSQDNEDSTPTPVTPDDASSQTDIYIDANETNQVVVTKEPDTAAEEVAEGPSPAAAAATGTTPPLVHSGGFNSGISSLTHACGAVSYAVLLKKDATSLSSSGPEYTASESSRNSGEKQDNGELQILLECSNALAPASSLNGEESLSRKSSFVSELYPDSEKGEFNGELNKSVASTGSEGRKKRKPNWYSVLSPNYKSKCEDFKRLFKDIPADERLMVDYSCALQRDILVHGRLYITQNWICFYANIFRWETQICIRCRDITAMTKEKTARVIPNAIQIITKTEKLFFTSFGARDKTYLMLFRVWQNALMEQPMVPQEMWQWVHYSYGEELGLTSSDDDYIAPSSENDKTSDTPHSPPDSSLISIYTRSPRTYKACAIQCTRRNSSPIIGMPNGDGKLRPRTRIYSESRLHRNGELHGKCSGMRAVPYGKQWMNTTSLLCVCKQKRKKKESLNEKISAYVSNLITNAALPNLDDIPQGRVLKLKMPAPQSVVSESNSMLRTSHVMKSVSPKLLKRKMPVPQLRVEDYAERRSSCPAIETVIYRELNTEASTVVRPPKGRSLSPQPRKRETLRTEDVKRSVSDPDINIVWSPIMYSMGHGNWDSLSASNNAIDNGPVETAEPLPREYLEQAEGRRGKTVGSLPVEDLNVTPMLDQSGLPIDFDSPDNIGDDLPTDLSDNTDCSDPEEVACSGHDHSGLTTVDEIFEMTVDEMFACLFTDSAFYINLQNAKKTQDLDLTKWADEPDADGHVRRVITYTLTLNNPLGPKNSYVREIQTRSHHCKPGTIYIIDCEVNNSGVPYSDNFYVANRYCITKAGSLKCRLRVSCQVKYRKNVWGVVRTFIDKNVTQGLTEHFTMLAAMLRKECIDKSGRNAPLDGHVTQSSVKKRVRRRRRMMTELNQSPSRLPDVASVTHVSSRVQVPYRRSAEDVRLSTANVESQLKIFSIVLLVLILLNIVLYYNVCILEINLRDSYPHSIPSNMKLPESAGEWRELLEKQQRLHHAELERWKDVIGSSILLMDQVKQSLHEVRTSLDRQPPVANEAETPS